MLPDCYPWRLATGTSPCLARFHPMNVQTPRQVGERQVDEKPRTPRFDSRDRLILALYAQLKAERETRSAFEEAIANGVLSRDVLEALVSDPVPVVTSEEIAAIERLLARKSERRPPPRRKIGF